MATEWHERIKKYIAEYGKKLKYSGKIVRVGKGGKSINITHPDRKVPHIPYKPDVYYVYKNRKIVVFEVVDSQTDDEVHADVIKSLIADNVSTLFFVVNNKTREEEVYNNADIIFKRTLDLFDCTPIKNFTIRVLNVPPSKSKTKGYIFSKLEQENL